MESNKTAFDLISLLQQVPLFEGLTAVELQEIAAAGSYFKAAEGSYVFMQGDEADTFYVLLSGRARISQLTTDGQQIILRVLGQGQMAGGVAFLGGDVYPVTCEAVESSLALCWKSAVLKGFLAHYPAMISNVLRFMANHVRETQDLLRELTTERVERRLARALLRLTSQLGKKGPEGILIEFPLSRQNIAEMTGTTLYTVSRILSQWEKDGFIHCGRERVIIVHPHSLVVIAEDLKLK